MKIKTITIFLTLFTTASSCKKSNTGGEITVAAITKHHDRIIPFSVVYIKYGANEFPGDDLSKYNASQQTDKEGHTHFKNLRYGKYYFYGVGYDSLSQATVKGGVALIVKWKERKNKIELQIPVTE